jgi:hypothetical protein
MNRGTNCELACRGRRAKMAKYQIAKCARTEFRIFRTIALRHFRTARQGVQISQFVPPIFFSSIK